MILLNPCHYFFLFLAQNSNHLKTHNLFNHFLKENILNRNKNLKQFYDKVYVKDSKRHFTTFIIDELDTPTSDVKEVLKQIKWKSKKVLDVGCGTGFFAFNAAKKGANVLGIDYSQKAIEEAKIRYQHKNLEFKVADVKKINEKFDVIVSNGTLEHLDDPLKILKLFKLHLKPKGKIIITSPNWANLRGYILMTLWYLFKAPITLADLHYFTPIDFQKFAQKLNMKIKWITYDKSWSHGDILIKDLERRLPKVLGDANLPKNTKQIKSFNTWIEKNIIPLNNDLPQSGATGLYVFSL